MEGDSLFRGTFSVGPLTGARARVTLESLAGLVERQKLNDLELVVSELIALCIRHAEWRSDEEIEVRIWWTPSGLRLELRCAPAARVRGKEEIYVDAAGLLILTRITAGWGIEERDSQLIAWAELVDDLVVSEPLASAPGSRPTPSGSSPAAPPG